MKDSKHPENSKTPDNLGATALRRRRLLDQLEGGSEVSIAEFVNELGASEATIRRDLSLLEDQGELVRTFGGARRGKLPSLVERTFGNRRTVNVDEKRAIAARAADLVKPGMTLAMDSGTTVAEIAKVLAKREIPLTVITSSLPVLENLGECPDIQVHLVGGEFRLENLDFIGPQLLEGFLRLRADLAILGADSYHPGRGFFATDPVSAGISSAIGTCADHCVIAMDSSKIGAQGIYQRLPHDAIGTFITDWKLSQDHLKVLKQEPFELIQTTKLD